MKKLIKNISMFALVMFMAVAVVACGKSKNNDGGANCDVAETVGLSSIVFNEVEFDNADTVKLEQDCDEVKITGTIEAMSQSQKNVFGVEDVTHAVVIKLTFDKERTIESFETKGDVTKVYSADNTVDNYAGTLTDLLDNGTGEDAYTNLILSAHTKEYELTINYTDGSESVIKVEIEATLATAQA